VNDTRENPSMRNPCRKSDKIITYLWSIYRSQKWGAMKLQRLLHHASVLIFLESEGDCRSQGRPIHSDKHEERFVVVHAGLHPIGETLLFEATCGLDCDCRSFQCEPVVFLEKRTKLIARVAIATKKIDPFIDNN
jgi:hypothetical protein